MITREQTRKQVADLQQRLRDAYLRHDPLARDFVRLLEALIVDGKDKLLDAGPDDLVKVQATTRKLREIHRELTQLPPGLPQ